MSVGFENVASWRSRLSRFDSWTLSPPGKRPKASLSRGRAAFNPKPEIGEKKVLVDAKQTATRGF